MYGSKSAFNQKRLALTADGGGAGRVCHGAFAATQTALRRLRRLARGGSLGGLAIACALTACGPARKPPAKAAIAPEIGVPLPCLDEVIIRKPNAQCEPLANGQLHCKDFDAVFHCYRVHPKPRT